MAEFMAGILDHSNLRPEGTMVQVTPTKGTDDFDIVAMISVRDRRFSPLDRQAVDWFYTDDSEDKGLERDGECDNSLILEGDCVWEEDDEDTTGRDGNIFEEFRATPGETMTFYAWVGRTDRDEFDESSSTFSKAEASSNKGPRSLRVTFDDVPSNAARIGDGGPYIVDLDRHSNIEFLIQLLDEDGDVLEFEGVEIEVEVESREISVTAEIVDSDDYPAPDYFELGSDSSDDSTLLTDRDGEAVFELDAPRRTDRLDEVVISAECCETWSVEIAWSAQDPVLVTARPNFDLYRQRSSGNRIKFSVGYDLYDQFGNALRGIGPSQTGRDGTKLKARLAYDLYSVRRLDSGGAVEIHDGAEKKMTTIARGRATDSVDVTIAEGFEDDAGFFVHLKPSIFTESDDDDTRETDEIRYGDPSGTVVWIVEDAVSNSKVPEACVLTNGPSGVDLLPVDANVDEREFRTCFTLWSYDSNDRFLRGTDDLTMAEFEEGLATVASLGDIAVRLYSDRVSQLSIFVLDPP